MNRRVGARTAASRHSVGTEKGRTVTWSREGQGDGPAIGFTSPRSSNGRMLALTAERSRSESWPGNQVLESSGAVAGGTAATPDHNLGIGPRSMTVASNIVDSLLFCQRHASGPAPVTDWARHEHPASRQAN